MMSFEDEDNGHSIRNKKDFYTIITITITITITIKFMILEVGPLHTCLDSHTDKQDY